MSATDVCRLCLTKDNLVWIFDKRFNSSDNMKDVIYITTGVEILKKDIISQKICRKCCQVTIKMFEFRRTSLKNDKHLKEECRKHLKENSIKIPNTEVIIKSESKCKNDEVKTESKCKNDEVKTDSKQDVSKPVFKIHPSVRDLFRVYPQIKLPTVCLKSHITPLVSMPMDDVENYFKARKLDFNLHTKLALKSGRKVATKKTSSAAKPKTVNSSSSSKPDTVEIVAGISEKKDNVVGTIKIKVPSSNFVVKNSDKVKDTASTSHSKNKDIAKVNFDKDTTTSPHSKNKDIAKVIIKDTATIPPSKNNDVTSKSDANKSYIDLTKTKVNSKDESLVNIPVNRKRKYSETDDSSKTISQKQPNLIEALGLTPKSNGPASTSITESPLSYIASKSVPLHICTMCNSVQYSAKDLRKHQLKHLRCQFCKTKFRTLETKTNHIANTCIIKNTMNNLPSVPLKRVECRAKVRRRYPEAFVNFPPLKKASVVKDKSPTIKKKHRRKTAKKIKPEMIFTPLDPKDIIDIGEIIDITSDDENLPSKSAGVDKLATGTVTAQGTKTGNDANAASPSTSVNTSIDLAPITENVVYNTVSIVKPDIRIKNSNLLENIESAEPKLTDVKILKELIKAKPLLQLTIPRSTQTEVPSNQSIVTNRSDLTAELKDLKQQLYMYKIPVVIKNGQFNVIYNNNYTDVKPPKKLSLWNDLKPTDIKTVNLASSVPAVAEHASKNNKNQHLRDVSTVPPTTNDKLTEVERPKNKTTAVNESSNVQRSDNTIILPSTATYNFSGVPSVQTTTTTSLPVSVNISTVNSNHSTLAVCPTADTIESNPMLNNVLESESATTCATTATATPQRAIVATPPQPTSFQSNVGTPIINTPTPIPLGLIRVKDVWELS